MASRVIGQAGLAGWGLVGKSSDKGCQLACIREVSGRLV